MRGSRRKESDYGMEREKQHSPQIENESSQMTEKNKSKNVLRMVRIGVQFLFLFLMPSLFAQAFGGVKEILTEMGAGRGLHLSVFVVTFLILCGLTIAFGRIFCGWVCAFGALGDWIYQFSSFVQKKTNRNLPELPLKWLHILQKIKYFVLTAILLLCFMGRNEIVTKYSPWTVFSLLAAGNFSLGQYLIGVALLLMIVAGMFFQERFFCQCLCPLGAVFSLLPIVPLPVWKRNEKNCISNCQICRRKCPVHIKLGEESLQEGECIRCGRCKVECPRGNIGIH